MPGVPPMGMMPMPMPPQYAGEAGQGVYRMFQGVLLPALAWALKLIQCRHRHGVVRACQACTQRFAIHTCSGLS
jgi:hypothetical protein